MIQQLSRFRVKPLVGIAVRVG